MADRISDRPIEELRKIFKESGEKFCDYYLELEAKGELPPEDLINLRTAQAIRKARQQTQRLP